MATPIRDYLLLKYAANSAMVWQARYHSPANQPSVAQKIALDPSGNALITGWSHNGVTYDYMTVKYNGSTGSQMWAKEYNGGWGDFANDLAVDGSGNAYITGRSGDLNKVDDILTLKLDPNGGYQWYERYNSGGVDIGLAIRVDSAGSVTVAGNAGPDGIMLKYGSNGVVLSTALYDNGSTDSMRSVTLDGQGNAYGAGWSYANGIQDYVTIRYSAQ